MNQSEGGAPSRRRWQRPSPRPGLRTGSAALLGNHGRSALFAAAWKTGEISLPVTMTVFGEDAYRPPETWARRAYRNLIYFHEADRGGHFAAWEQPQLSSEESRAAFRSFR